MSVLLTSPIRMPLGAVFYVSPTKFGSATVPMTPPTSKPPVKDLSSLLHSLKRPVEEQENIPEEDDVIRVYKLRRAQGMSRLLPSVTSREELFRAGLCSAERTTIHVDNMMRLLFGSAEFFTQVLDLWFVASIHHTNARLLFWNIYDQILPSASSSSTSSSSIHLFECCIQELLLHYAQHTNVRKNHYSMISFKLPTADPSGKISYQLITGYREESLVDAYVIMKDVGYGAYGQVQKVLNVFTKHAFALKTPHHEEDYWTEDSTGEKAGCLQSSDPKLSAEMAEALLEKEIQNLKDLGKHPYFQEYENHFKLHDKLCLITPYYSGPNLRTWCYQDPEHSGHVRIALCKKIVLTILRSLQEEYKKRKTRHGDIKLANIIVGDSLDMPLRLLDWAGGTIKQSSGIFSMGCYTPDYFPEELLNELNAAKIENNQKRWDEADQRRDRTATGITLYAVLTKNFYKVTATSKESQQEKLTALGYSTELVNAVFALRAPLSMPFVPFSDIEAIWVKIDPMKDYCTPLKLSPALSCPASLRSLASLQRLLDQGVSSNC